MQYYNLDSDYELLDLGDTEKLEKWGKYILIRPDPQAIFSKSNPKLWDKAHARYIRSNTGGGHWEKLKNMNDAWSISICGLKFNLKLMGFKHTGLFPEQAVNWEYLMNKINEKNIENKKNNIEYKIKVLNLFGYTGGATVACLKAGASVCHVDSSSGIISLAKENVKLNNLEKESVRFIVDDTVKFVKREIRRDNKYDIIIMDPPSYGRGKNGEVWNLEENLNEFILDCSKLLKKDSICMLVNTYTGGLSGNIIKNVIRKNMNENNFDKITTNEIGLVSNDNLNILPCGITTKWEN